MGWLIATLAAACGLPFLVVASTGPLLQRWFSRSGAARARDPDFLYAASNLGSLGGLLAYPFLLEPALPVATPSAGSGLSQTSLWTAGYVLFALLLAACGALAVRAARAGPAPPEPAPSVPPPTLATWGLWGVLACWLGRRGNCTGMPWPVAPWQEAQAGTPEPCTPPR